MDPEIASAETPEPPPFVVASPVTPPAPAPLHMALAGLESGILGGLIMTAWFALDSILERQYWWAILNLWGAAVFHNRVFTMGFGLATLTGGATLFFLHGIGGIVWALIGARLRNPWLHLVLSFAAAAVWYLVLLHGFWQAAAPVVTRMSPMPATILAYVLYGAALSRNAFRARQLGLVWKT